MIAAVVLAAGRSLRMGVPKLVMPWGKTTVIGRVVDVLKEAGLGEILVVTGGSREEISTALRDQPVQMVNNPDYRMGEMLSSCQLGLKRLPQDAEAALIVLGDQPQIQPEVVEKVIRTYRESKAELVVPSYQMHRGHPWLVRRDLWPAILALQASETLRDFLHQNHGRITYVPVDTDSVIKDLDTPEDYRQEKPPDQA